MIGNDYRSAHGYYGEYPASYLQRIHSMFPDAVKVLHLFSGMVEKGLWPNEWLLDRRPELHPDILMDVSTTSDWPQIALEILGGPVDLILADPPYSEEDAQHYGTCLVNRNAVVQQCRLLCKPGGHLVWLDQVYPMYSKLDWNPVATIGLWRSTNHRFRGVTIWERTLT